MVSDQDRISNALACFVRGHCLLYGVEEHRSGSPFEPVTVNGVTHTIAQSNNAYIFPGLGLGILASGATRVSDEMFMVAAQALAESVTATPSSVQAAPSKLPVSTSILHRVPVCADRRMFTTLFDVSYRALTQTTRTLSAPCRLRKHKSLRVPGAASANHSAAST